MFLFPIILLRCFRGLAQGEDSRSYQRILSSKVRALEASKLDELIAVMSINAG